MKHRAPHLRKRKLDLGHDHGHEVSNSNRRPLPAPVLRSPYGAVHPYVASGNARLRRGGALFSANAEKRRKLVSSTPDRVRASAVAGYMEEAPVRHILEVRKPLLGGLLISRAAKALALGALVRAGRISPESPYEAAPARPPMIPGGLAARALAQVSRGDLPCVQRPERWSIRAPAEASVRKRRHVWC